MTKLTGAVFTFTVSGITFTVGDEAYIGTHRTAPVSFITFTVEANCNPVNHHKGAYENGGGA